MSLKSMTAEIAIRGEEETLDPVDCTLAVKSAADHKY